MLKICSKKKKKSSVDMCCADPSLACKKGNFSLFSFTKTEQVMFGTLLMPNPYPIGPVGAGKVVGGGLDNIIHSKQVRIKREIKMILKLNSSL